MPVWIIYLKICIFHAVENVTEKTTKTEETNFFAKYKMLSIFDCFDFLFVIYTLPAVMVSSNWSLTGCKTQSVIFAVCHPVDGGCHDLHQVRAAHSGPSEREPLG